MFKTMIICSREVFENAMLNEDNIELISIDDVRKVDPEFPDDFKRYGYVGYPVNDLSTVAFVFGDENGWCEAGLPVID